MSSVFDYPFDSSAIMRNSRKLRKELTEDGTVRVKKKIAILAGSTADAVRDITELFLLNYGIEPEFYLSEYGQYYNDAVYPPQELLDFHPDLVYIYTTERNITNYPKVRSTVEEVDSLLDAEFARFTEIWDSVWEKLKCPVIQNNFEQPPFRLLGNSDVSDIHGRLNFVNRLNTRFAEEASRRESFYICDINYVSSCYGLDRWQDMTQWYMYKYALSMNAVPYLAQNIAAVIKALYGRNKKVLALDLDNTLWGGIVGDDGAENLQIGRDLPGGQVYSEFQDYVKLHKDIGVLLTVCSKNDMGAALAGLSHPDATLTSDDFTVIKANWENKDINLLETAEELSLLPEGIVFADDNPAERKIAEDRIKGISVPDMDGAENYIRILDRNRYFEVTKLSADDLNRNEMYKANAARAAAKKGIADYGEYLDSLEMKADIKSFEPMYIARIAQLTNKSNQFNVTTRRYSEAEIANISRDAGYIKLYGRLTDKFGDNGVVSVVIGSIKGAELHIDLWIMSCRVLKRDMELAMLDELMRQAAEKGIETVYGVYIPTSKNAMVKELFGSFGFEKLRTDSDGTTTWRMNVSGYEPKNTHIMVNTEQ